MKLVLLPYPVFLCLSRFDRIWAEAHQFVSWGCSSQTENNFWFRLLKDITSYTTSIKLHPEFKQMQKLNLLTKMRERKFQMKWGFSALKHNDESYLRIFLVPWNRRCLNSYFSRFGMVCVIRIWLWMIIIRRRGSGVTAHRNEVFHQVVAEIWRIAVWSSLESLTGLKLISKSVITHGLSVIKR